MTSQNKPLNCVCWVLCLSNGEVTQTDIAIRKVGSLLWLYLTRWFRSLWNLFAGGVRKSLEKWTREALDCCEQCWVWNAGQSSEDKNVDRNVNSKGQAWEISVGNQDSIGSWRRGHVYYALAQNFSTFRLCSETLWGTEIKGSRLINLVKETSGQPKDCNMDTADYF